MRVLDYSDWLEKDGYDYGELIAEWLEKRPMNISLKSLGIYDIDDYVQEQVLEAYEDYISEVEDRAYHEMRDEELCND